jgi:hypothetical protein
MPLIGRGVDQLLDVGRRHRGQLAGQPTRNEECFGVITTCTACLWGPVQSVPLADTASRAKLCHQATENWALTSFQSVPVSS